MIGIIYSIISLYTLLVCAHTFESNDTSIIIIIITVISFMAWHGSLLSVICRLYMSDYTYWSAITMLYSYYYCRCDYYYHCYDYDSNI